MFEGIVQCLNRFCWQKSAGTYILPEVPASLFCLLCCNQYCLCLGSFCKGKKPPKEIKMHKSRCHYQKYPLIPGLVGTSYEVRTQPKKIVGKKKMSALSPRDPIYNWTCKNFKLGSASIVTETNSVDSKALILRPGPISSPEKKLPSTQKQGNCDRRKLRSILLNSSLSLERKKRNAVNDEKFLITNIKDMSKSTEALPIVSTSLERKLNISELCCKTKKTHERLPQTFQFRFPDMKFVTLGGDNKKKTKTDMEGEVYIFGFRL